MTDPTTPANDEPAEAAPETSNAAPGGAGTAADPQASRWGEPPPAGATGGAAGAATSILESLRDAIDDLAERATPTVKEYSVKAAELAAVAADKTAPLARKAGEATADASSKLADKSRSWAAGVRDSLGSAGEEAAPEPDGASEPPPSPEDATPAS